MKHMIGLLKPDSGKVLVEGETRALRPPSSSGAAQVRHGV